MIQERYYCLVSVTRSMQPVHIALTMAPRSSKGSSQPMAESSGKSSAPLVLVHRIDTNLMDAVRGMEVYAYSISTAHTLCSRHPSMFQRLHGGHWFVIYILHLLLLTRSTEDAPAPAALHSFQTHVADGKIYVTADPANTTKEKKSRPPKLLSSGSEAGGAGVVIVGGGSGAFHATESLREASHASLLAGLNRILTFTSMGSKRRSR